MERKKTSSSYPLRIEPELTEWVKERARKNNRSVNAELARMIRKTREAEEIKAA